MNNKKKTHIKKNEFLFGINSVTEALNSKRRTFYEILLAGDKGSKRISIIEKLASNSKIPVRKLAVQELSKLSGTDSHQGVVARVGEYPFAAFSDLLHPTKGTGPEPFLLLLDGVEDPQNLGAITRTALCAGVDGIIIPKDRAASPTPSASKASAGALEHIALTQVTNLVNTIKELKKEGFWIAGLDAEADSSLYEHDLTVPLGVVVGGEGRGVRDLVRKNCDFIISIPQKGPVNSLNASVAGALVMYEVVRQRAKGSD